MRFQPYAHQYNHFLSELELVEFPAKVTPQICSCKFQVTALTILKLSVNSQINMKQNPELAISTLSFLSKIATIKKALQRLQSQGREANIQNFSLSSNSPKQTSVYALKNQAVHSLILNRL